MARPHRWLEVGLEPRAVETLLNAARRETWLGNISPTAPKSLPKNWAAMQKTGSSTPKAALPHNMSGARC
jgi:hypothetical protein